MTFPKVRPGICSRRLEDPARNVGRKFSVVQEDNFKAYSMFRRDLTGRHKTGELKLGDPV